MVGVGQILLPNHVLPTIDLDDDPFASTKDDTTFIIHRPYVSQLASFFVDASPSLLITTDPRRGTIVLVAHLDENTPQVPD